MLTTHVKKTPQPPVKCRCRTRLSQREHWGTVSKDSSAGLAPGELPLKAQGLGGMRPNATPDFPGDLAGLYSIPGLTGLRAPTRWALKGAQWLSPAPGHAAEAVSCRVQWLQSCGGLGKVGRAGRAMGSPNTEARFSPLVLPSKGGSWLEGKLRRVHWAWQPPSLQPTSLLSIYKHSRTPRLGNPRAVLGAPV